MYVHAQLQSNEIFNAQLTRGRQLQTGCSARRETDSYRLSLCPIFSPRLRCALRTADTVTQGKPHKQSGNSHPQWHLKLSATPIPSQFYWSSSSPCYGWSVGVAAGGGIARLRRWSGYSQEPPRTPYFQLFIIRLLFLFFSKTSSDSYPFLLSDRLLTRRHRYWSQRGVRGPRPLPFFGTYLRQFFVPMQHLEEERFHTYGKIYG